MFEYFINNLKEGAIMENYDENEINIDIGQILNKLCNFKTVRNIVISGVICGVCAFGYSKLCIPEQFTSQVSMYVNNNAIMTTGGKVDISDINASQKIVESCIVILKDDIVMEEISQKLMTDYTSNEINEAFSISVDEDGKVFVPASELSSSISLTDVNETEVLNIKVTTKSPKISNAVCGYMAEIAPQMVKRVIDGGRIEAIGKPSVPKVKSYPNNTKNGIVGAFFGICVMLMFYVLRILLDTKVKTQEEFIQKFNIPVLAEIPLYGNENDNRSIKLNKKKTKNENYVDENAFSVVEAYNGLSSNVIFSCRANDSKIIVVSSAEIGDGKSTTAFKIAESLSNISGNVLIIDCDMRRPTVHKKMDLKNDKGLSHILSGRVSLDEAIIKKEGLPDVITAGKNPPNVAEILASKYMDELMKECAERYDYIIVDTPPVNVVNDACILSRFCNGIIFVAKSGMTKYREIEKAEINLKLVGSKINGVVINAVDTEAMYYGRYGRYKYYNYEYSDKNSDKKQAAVAKE